MMKKIKKAVTLFLVLAITINIAKAQKQIKEGVITYSATYDIPADQLKNYGALPSIIITYFRGDSSAAIVNQGAAIVKGVSVLKTNYHSMIIDVPSMSKKIVVVLTPTEVAQEKAENPQFTGKNGTEKQVINGYNCTKTIITDTKSGATYDIWLTNDIDIAPNSVSKLVSTFGGVPIKFVTFNSGVKINVQLEELEETPVPAGFFTAGKDYQAISYDELKGASGKGN
jgi:hypothetical protein